MRIGRWSEHRFPFDCQFVEVISEADGNEISGEDGLAFLDILVGESQLLILKFELDIMFSNMVLLIAAELECHAEGCATVH